MIQIDNPLHRYIAWGVDLVGRIIFKIFLPKLGSIFLESFPIIPFLEKL